MKREGRFGPLFLIVILFSHTHLRALLFLQLFFHLCRVLYFRDSS